MHSIELKSTDTDVVVLKGTMQQTGFRSDSDLFDPEKHAIVTFPYRDTLRVIVARPIIQGAVPTNEDFHHASNLIRRLRKSRQGEALYLEDDDYAYLVRAVNAFPFETLEFWVSDFREDIFNAPKINDEELNQALNGKVDNVKELVKA